MKKTVNKAKLLISILCVALVAGIFIGCKVYLNDYYRADIEAIEEYVAADSVSKEILEDNTIVYVPEEINAGLIFYPGGKVEYTAYEPLMKALAAEGILCVLVEMPFNLAVLDINAATGIQEMYPDLENWYIGGHSLGGSMAASYLKDNAKDYAGLILLGAYSTADLSETTLKVLSVYGSEDKVMNKEKYSDNIENLPSDYMEIILEGGCHAYFGMYGEQEGDGIPTISNEEQIDITVEAIVDFVY